MLFKVHPQLDIWENVELWIFLLWGLSHWGQEMHEYILKGTCWPSRAWHIPNYEVIKVCLRCLGATARAFGVLPGRTIFRNTADLFLWLNPISREKIVLPCPSSDTDKRQVQGWVGTGSGQKLVCSKTACNDFLVLDFPLFRQSPGLYLAQSQLPHCLSSLHFLFH